MPIECKRCNGSGEIGLRNNIRAAYVGPGPVPDDARGVFSATCDVCLGMCYVEEPDDLDDEECGNFSAGSPPR